MLSTRGGLGELTRQPGVGNQVMSRHVRHGSGSSEPRQDKDQGHCICQVRAGKKGLKTGQVGNRYADSPEEA